MAETQEYIAKGDEELFGLVQKDDAEAFSVLYNRYQRRLYTYCFRMLGTVPQAQDVFQDVVLKMYERRHSFTGGNFAKWLFTIARTTCLNTFRDVKHTAEADILAEMLITEGNFSGGDDEYIQSVVQKAVASLPPEFREVVVLREFEGYSNQEISELLGIGTSLVKVRLFRAMKILKKSLKPLLQEVR